MKPSADTRKPYTGTTRSLVLACDVGTTFSGVSYAILEPGEIPKIHGVTRFPGQEHVAGNSKIPSILYYDSEGRMMAAGAEADTSSVLSAAEDEGWIKVELFKLRLRPRTMKLNMNGMRLGPLPYRKTAVDVFGDWLSYLYTCTRNFIVDTHANGSSLWKAVEHDIQFVLSHPNGWEGAQQTKMRRAAVYGGLIPDTNEGKARIRFVTEGEASLHACVLNGLAADVLSGPSKSGFLVADAGGGTLDLSSYTIRAQAPLVIEEIAPPDCVFAGSVFVSRRARELFQEKLKNSKYGTPDAVDHITKRFDETTKRLFRDKKDSQYIPFGSPLDKDPVVGIRSGQLKLSGAEVADLFEPSIQAAVSAIKAQIDASQGMIKSVFLVGGYAASAWLFSQLQERLRPYRVSVSRPDTQTSKAVADGAVGFYCDHHVSARMSKFMYGVEYLRQYNAEDPDHVGRKDRLCELPSGPRLLPDAFDCILARGVKVKESTVFTRKYCTELTSLSLLSVFEVEIWCYRGGNTIPKWIMRQAEDFSTLCLVRADLSPLSSSAEAKSGKHGRVYWNIVFSVEIHFGLTEFRARIKWVDNGVTKYGPASIIYNERGHRLDEDEPDGIPEDDMTPAHSRVDRSLPGSRNRSVDSFHTPVVSTSASKRSSMLGPARHESTVPDVMPAPSMPASSVRSRSHMSSISRAPTEASRVEASRDPSRGRSSYKGKERAISTASTAPIADDGIRTRTSSGRLGDTLSSVWGGAISPVTKSTSSQRSKEATPLSSPVKRELRDILTSPPVPPGDESASFANAEDVPQPTTGMPGYFGADPVVPDAVPSLSNGFAHDTAAWGSFGAAGEASSMGPSSLRIETSSLNPPPPISTNRSASAIISPISFPDVPVASNTLPIADAGDLSNENEFSDLLSPPVSATSPGHTNNLADLLGNSGVKSHKSSKAATPTAAVSPKSPWSTKASPKPPSSPNTAGPSAAAEAEASQTTPAEVPATMSRTPSAWGSSTPAEVPATPSKTPSAWGASKPASKAATPKNATPKQSLTPKAATPQAGTPKAGATPKAATPIPASSPKPETSELPPTTSESEPQGESEEPKEDSATPAESAPAPPAAEDATSQAPEVAEPAAEAPSDAAQPGETMAPEVTAESTPADPPAEAATEGETKAEGDATTAATPIDSTPVTPGDELGEEWAFLDGNANGNGEAVKEEAKEEEGEEETGGKGNKKKKAKGGGKKKKK